MIAENRLSLLKEALWDLTKGDSDQANFSVILSLMSSAVGRKGEHEYVIAVLDLVSGYLENMYLKTGLDKHRAKQIIQLQSIFYDKLIRELDSIKNPNIEKRIETLRAYFSLYPH